MARILAVNAGSSSLKLSLIGDDDETLARKEISTPGAPADSSEIEQALTGGLEQADLVAHRIVHGGDRFYEAVLVDATVEACLRELTELAPLHQPKSLAALDAVSAVLPDVPAVACFDTAFHASLPAAARTYALPRAWRRRWPLHRYGFHGLSHGWIARRVPEMLEIDDQSALRVVSCHLGAGASLCAIAGGISVATTMGFTPLEGLVMATRSGTVDPGMLLWLLERSGMSERQVAHALEHESGLLGLCGTADMREVMARERRGDGEAALALEVYLDRLRGGIAAMAAALGGLDALVFTGGVGEHAPEVRSEAVAGLEFMGVAIDPDLNAALEGEAGEITLPGSEVRVVVLPAREDLEMARQARAALGTIRS
jgi:acetate kinase